MWERVTRRARRPRREKSNRSTRDIAPPRSRSNTRREYSPSSLTTTHESGSAAGKVTTARAAEGSLNCASDHSLLKYLGRNFFTRSDAGDAGRSTPFLDVDGAGEAEAEDEPALGASGTRNTCTVPLSLVTPRRFFLEEKASEYTRARSEPRLNS